MKSNSKQEHWFMVQAKKIGYVQFQIVVFIVVGIIYFLSKLF